MREYDVDVIGSGSGMLIVNESLSHGAMMALIDRGPRMGGTCLKWGCVPSRMLIHVTDRIMEMQGARDLGVPAEPEDLDFSTIMGRSSSRLWAWKPFSSSPIINYLIWQHIRAEKQKGQQRRCKHVRTQRSECSRWRKGDRT